MYKTISRFRGSKSMTEGFETECNNRNTRLFLYLLLLLLLLLLSQVIYSFFAISHTIYLPIHYFPEMLMIVVALRIFGIGWHIVRDPLSHQRSLNEKLTQSNKKIRSILDVSRDGILLISKEGEILETNLASKAALGYKMEELIGESLQKLFPEDDQAQWDTVLQSIRTGRKNSFCGRVFQHSGYSVPVELNIQPLMLDGIEYAVILVCDLTEHHKSMEIAKGVFEDATEGIIITDFEGNITTVNRAFTRITGYTSEEVMGRNPRILKSDRHDAAYYREMWTSLQTKRYWQGEVWNRHKDGAIYPELLTITSIHNLSNKLTNYLGIFLDRTEYRELEETINQLAHYDTLTGLPNQSLFLERLNSAIEQKTHCGGGLAVCVINVKNFKEINSLIGHNQANELLKEVASRFRSIIQNDEVIARINGAEFGLFHFAESGAVREITLVAQKLLEQIQMPWRTAELELKVTANIGIAVYP
ncbi:MAG: PAS domain S-box protein, partial [Desulfitobacteriaceae bacterium]